MKLDKKGVAEGTQHARFVETARALGCDGDDAAFDEKLKWIAKQKPSAMGKRRPVKGTHR